MGKQADKQHLSSSISTLAEHFSYIATQAQELNNQIKNIKQIKKKTFKGQVPKGKGKLKEPWGY